MKEANGALALYPRLLGAGWRELPAAVRSLHIESGPVKARGQLKVSHGKNIFARLIVRLMGMPREAAQVETRLNIATIANGEEWLRFFGDHELVTQQWEAAGGLLVERMGLVELQFKLEIINGTLYYRQTGMVVNLGLCSLPLPRWLVPATAAWEKPGKHARETEISVQITAPIIGPLISYQGFMERAD
jgi:hypothetical protein